MRFRRHRRGSEHSKGCKGKAKESGERLLNFTPVLVRHTQKDSGRYIPFPQQSGSYLNRVRIFIFQKSDSFAWAYVTGILTFPATLQFNALTFQRLGIVTSPLNL